MPLTQDDPSWPAFQAFVEKYNKRYNSVSETRGKFSPSAAFSMAVSGAVNDGVLIT